MENLLGVRYIPPEEADEVLASYLMVQPEIVDKARSVPVHERNLKLKADFEVKQKENKDIVLQFRREQIERRKKKNEERQKELKKLNDELQSSHLEATQKKEQTLK